MAKKIRFPLKLAEGAEVRTLEELREHFDLEALLGYYKNKKLLTWLEDRYLEGEAEAVRALDEAAPDFQKRLCEVFQVEYTGSEVDLEEVGRRQERLKRLRMVTDEQEYIDHIDQVAFDQEDLADLLDEEQTTIYLCGEKFTVPASRKGVAYVGIHEPAVHISGTLPEDPEELGIEFRGCAVDNLPVAKPGIPDVTRAEVTGIHLEAERGGYRTIQVDLKHPVFLDGVRYDHVPVLSAGLFEEMGLREGSEVEVRRVGDVIPSITVLKSGTGKTLSIDKLHCDSCGSPLEVKNKKLYCGNPGCSGNMVGRIVGFLEGIGMEGYSDGFAEFLLEEFGSKSKDVQIKSLGDLYRLTGNVLDAHHIDRADIRSFREKLIRATKTAPDYVVFGSMGYPDIGVARAKLIFREFQCDSFVREKSDNPWVNLEKLTCKLYGERMGSADAVINAIGKVYGNKFVDFMHDGADDRIDAIKEELLRIGYHATNITKNFDSVLKVGHTGYTPSADVRAACERNNFELVDGKSFDILITGDLRSTSGKMERANKNNLPVYTEETFLKKYA